MTFLVRFVAISHYWDYESTYGVRWSRSPRRNPLYRFDYLLSSIWFLHCVVDHFETAPWRGLCQVHQPGSRGLVHCSGSCRHYFVVLHVYTQSTRSARHGLSRNAWVLYQFGIEQNWICQWTQLFHFSIGCFLECGYLLPVRILFIVGSARLSSFCVAHGLPPRVLICWFFLGPGFSLWTFWCFVTALRDDKRSAIPLRDSTHSYREPIWSVPCTRGPVHPSSRI